MTVLGQHPPHLSVKLGSLLAGLENAWLFALYVGQRVTGNAAKCVIDLDNLGLGVGDDDSFAGMGEDLGC